MGEQKEALDMAIKALEQEPCEDAVSRKAVHNMLEDIPIVDTDKWFNWLQKACLRLADLPSVTPTQCIATVQFSKEDLRDICNERIEIECTHGTCKDCFYYNIDEDGHGYHCEKYGHTRFPVYADFYCKDFKKRGGENELN